MFDIRKYLPGYIEIRSIYWQENMLQVQDEIKTINDLTDQFFWMDDTHKAMKLRSKIEWLIGIYDRKWNPIINAGGCPMYFYLEVIKINHAKQMLDFCDIPIE
jgi:hypothetical protein